MEKTIFENLEQNSISTDYKTVELKDPIGNTYSFTFKESKSTLLKDYSTGKLNNKSNILLQ